MTTDNGMDDTGLSLDEYQRFTPTTAIYNKEREGDYLTAGLVSEVGELYGAMAKYHRGDYDYNEWSRRARAELGDIMWFISQYCNMYGWKLSDLIAANRSKLTRRQRERRLAGDGDDR